MSNEDPIIEEAAAPEEEPHHFPKEPVEPTVYAYAKAWSRPSPERWNQGHITLC